MLARSVVGEFPTALDAIFLHAVSGDSQPAPLPADADVRGVPLRYFRTYAMAAAKAFDLGLLGAGATRGVLEAIESDLAAGLHPAVVPGGLNERILLEDIAAARDIVGRGGGVSTVTDGLGAAITRPLRRLRKGTRR